MVGISPVLFLSPAVADDIEPGMKIEQARTLLGRAPDSTAQVGACGIMQVLTWNGERLRLIATDGVISAVVKPPPHPTEALAPPSQR